MTLTLQPAYGRDYRSKAAVVADFNADRDFVIATMAHPYAGKPVNRSQLAAEHVAEVNIRYQQNRRVTVVKVGS